MKLRGAIRAYPTSLEPYFYCHISVSALEPVNKSRNSYKNKLIRLGEKITEALESRMKDLKLIGSESFRLNYKVEDDGAVLPI